MHERNLAERNVFVMQNTKTKRLVESGLLIAMATILSLIKVFELPYGGSITLCSMLPIIVLGYRYGVKWGLFSGTVYGILQLVLGASGGAFKGTEFMIVIFVSLLDYIIAFAVLGLGGVFKNKIKNQTASLALGAVVAGFARYITHIISGFLFFGSYAEWYFSQEGFTLGAEILSKYSGNLLSIIYSVFYNSMYMIPEIVLTTIIAVIISGALNFSKERVHKN